MLVNVHDAQSQLSRLITAAEAGVNVVITRGGKPAVRLVPVGSGKFRFGSLAHHARTAPDFDEPLGKAELARWEGGP